MSLFTWEKGEPHFKTSKAAARAARDAEKQDVKDKEDRNKSMARRRDGWQCRFPRCACHRLRLHPEVAHCDGDKGMGGDHGTKSHVSQLICLCRARHRESRISLHRKTLRIEFLTPEKADGPVKWWVDIAMLADPYDQRPAWVVLGYETAVHVLAPLTTEQGQLLKRIADLQA